MVFHFLSLSLLFLFVHPSFSDKQDSNNKFEECGRTFSCGTLNFSYPFWSSTYNRPIYCGYHKFNLSCEEEVDDAPGIRIFNREFKILEVKENIIRLVDRYYRLDQCPENTTFQPSVFFKYLETVKNLTLLYDCNIGRGIRPVARSHCRSINGYPSRVYYEGDNVEGCVRVQVQVDKYFLAEVDRTMHLTDALLRGFDLQYIAYNQKCIDCKTSGGVCGSNENVKEEFRCFCPTNKYRPNSISCKTGGQMKLQIVFFVLTTGLVLLGFAVLLLWRNKRNKLKKKDYGEVGNEEDTDLELPLFNLNTIVTATDNFSYRNKVGQGGYGPVYKGVLVDGGEIAVKRLSETSDQGLVEFKNEVKLIAKLQHRNLVKLIGCCIQQKERMLVYEYLPNKSLNFFIFDKERRLLLDWSKRYNIINGIARGLLYLHQDSRLRIIHRDLKASNVLLDHQMNPKISDFGMARTFGGGNGEICTNRVVGTYGYMSPEYQLDGRFSIKSDVFSFGVTVLEIVSSKRNRGFWSPEHELNLLGHAWRLYKEERPFDLVDESIKETCTINEVLRSIHVGLLCVQHKQEDRPNMSTVVQMLTSEMELPQPNEPGFYIKRDVLQSESSSGVHEIYTTTELTITSLKPRD